MNISKMILANLSILTMFGARAGELEYAGACSWKPATFSLENCVHKKGNAIARFYFDKEKDQLLVDNYLSKEDEDFCLRPESINGKNLRQTTFSGGGISWVDKKGEKISKVDLRVEEINVTQASTNSFNYVQKNAGLPGLAYAPCHLNLQLL